MSSTRCSGSGRSRRSRYQSIRPRMVISVSRTIRVNWFCMSPGMARRRASSSTKKGEKSMRPDGGGGGGGSWARGGWFPGGGSGPGGGWSPRGGWSRRGGWSSRGGSSPEAGGSCPDAGGSAAPSPRRRPDQGSRARGSFSVLSIVFLREEHLEGPLLEASAGGGVGRHRGGQDDSPLLPADPHDHLEPDLLEVDVAAVGERQGEAQGGVAVLARELLGELVVQHPRRVVGCEQHLAQLVEPLRPDDLVAKPRCGEDRNRGEGGAD